MRHGLGLRKVKLTAALVAAAVALSSGALGGTVHAAADNSGAVYSLTNAVSGNAVAVFNRAANGALTPSGSYATGGAGTGVGLGSQGAIALSADNRWLFAVNAGDSSVSSFSVTPSGLNLASTVASNGQTPISLTVHGNLLYVLNAGGTGNITGFTVGDNGVLSALAGSTEPLSTTAANPAQVGFNPSGTILAVTEKDAGIIDTYAVGLNGRAGAPTSLSTGPIVPFGFAFDPAGRLIVSDAAINSLSSYSVGAGGALGLISQVADFQAAPCWVAVTKNGKFAYTANAHNGEISGYSIADDGSLSLLNADGKTAFTGGGPLDLGFSINSRYLYVLNNAQHAINAFQVGADGSLTALAGAGGLTPNSAGIAAR